MSPLDVTILTAALINLVFSAIVYLHSRRTTVVAIFAIFALNVSLWALATLLMTSRIVSFDAFTAGVMLHYLSGNFVFWCLLWFSVVYPNRKDHSLFLPVALSAINVGVIILIFSTRFLFISIQDAASLVDKITFDTRGYLILSIVTISMFVLSQIFLARKYFLAIGDEKTQIGGIILSTSIAGSLGLFTNLILPGFGNFSVFYVGPIIATPLFVGLMLYAIIKYKVFIHDAATTEIYTALLMIALAAELALANSSGELSGRGIVFLIAGVFGVFLIKSVYREIQAREEIERLNQTMSEFLAIASHQIRSPLTHIKGALSVIKEGDYGPVDARAQSLLNQVYLTTGRLIALVNDLLDMSRMESGRLQYVVKNFDFNELVDSVVGEFKLPAADKEVAIIWRKGKGPAPISGDQEKLRQVIFNLIDNALKYTRAGTVEIILKDEQDVVELSVKDSGIGMSSETIGRLFEKFSRGSEKEVHIQGTGLGLYVAKRIVEDHQGKLWAESGGPGKGSAFHLRLLANRADTKKREQSQDMNHLARAA